MRFNILYQYLTKQIIKPTTKAICRVYMAKDIRSYQRQYHQVMHQMIGASWDSTMQNIAYDSMLIKKIAKVSFGIIIFLISCYLLI